MKHEDTSDDALILLINFIVDCACERLKTEMLSRPTWISCEESMKLLNIKSKTTLQKLRDKGKIRYSQPPETKIIYYDYQSILDYIEDNVCETF